MDINSGDEMPLSPTEEKLDYLARTVDKALKFVKKQQEAEKELIKMLEKAEVNPVTLKYPI